MRATSLINNFLENYTEDFCTFVYLSGAIPPVIGKIQCFKNSMTVSTMQKQQWCWRRGWSLSPIVFLAILEFFTFIPGGARVR